MSFHLRSSLSTEAIRADFANQGFAHIANVLPAENAGRIHKSMTENTPWNLVFTDRGRHIDLPGAQVASMPKEKARELQQAIQAQARDSFQYCYNNYPIHDAHRAGLNRGHVLHVFYEWLNGTEFLDFARAATGVGDITFADAQATRFMPGHFLTTHDDESLNKHRRVAYIFNFTRDWRPDWGGYLQLLDDAGDVRRGLMPAFNALNILAVPQKHNVGFVAPFAGGMRLSISGWLRAGEREG
jgi:SM-20-related protein